MEILCNASGLFSIKFGAQFVVFFCLQKKNDSKKELVNLQIEIANDFFQENVEILNEETNEIEEKVLVRVIDLSDFILFVARERK